MTTGLQVNREKRSDAAFHVGEKERQKIERPETSPAWPAVVKVHRISLVGSLIYWARVRVASRCLCASTECDRAVRCFQIVLSCLVNCAAPGTRLASPATRLDRVERSAEFLTWAMDCS